jgi:hypothetical protein
MEKKKDFPDRKIHLYDVDGNIQQSSGGRVKMSQAGALEGCVLVHGQPS